MKYTLVFIQYNHQFLMLNRSKFPNMGLWNGVGGKIENNETPAKSAIRETYEETGIQLSSVTYKGDVLWISEEGIEGMHVFFATLPKSRLFPTPLSTEEGILDWKSIDWILNPKNIGIVENIRTFLPIMLKNTLPTEHIYTYEGDRIIDYQYHFLEAAK